MAARTGKLRENAKKETVLYEAKSSSSPSLKFLNWLQGLKLTLQLLGRPFFYLLFYLLYLFLIVGASARKLILLGKTLIVLPQISLPKPAFPKIKIPRWVFLFLFLLLFVFSLTASSYWLVIKDLPRPEKLTSRDQAVTTKILDRHGNLLYKIYRGQNRTLVELEEIPLFLRQATIAIEDAQFYQHHGFSWRGIIRSFYRNLFLGRLSGGSTITQQLVKNALLTPERTWLRKIKEGILAIWVETKFSKDEILKMYLNEVSYGGAAYGVEEASQLYFGKSVKDLRLSEAALLAGLPASPTTYSPFGAHPQLAKKRQEEVLQRMVEDGYLTEEESKRVKEQELKFAPQQTNILAPHFVMYVKELLVRKYGETMVENGGLEVRTSLDLAVQAMAEKAVAEEVAKLRSLHVTNGAALVTNPRTGEILAMVGSKDYFDTTNSGNFNVTTAPRQPGSSIKPVNYSVALAMGFTPATIIPDTPITYQVPGQPPYTPRNYDGRFHGNVPLRIALGSSYNVPAVKVLSALGVSRMIEQGQKMGITTWGDPSRFGLSLTLGGGEVKMTDMAVVYGTLVNLGARVDLRPILEVKDYQGKILERDNCTLLENNFVSGDETQLCQGTQVVNPQIAYLLTDILSDNSARTPAFGPNSLLVIPDHPSVAVKTGTTQNLRDNWTIGYTPDFVTVVWVGNNDNTPMSYVASGVTGASPIWHNIMAELLKDRPDEAFLLPGNLSKIEICPTTGTLPCSGCGGKWEYFLPGTEPKTHCIPEQLTPTPTP